MNVLEPKGGTPGGHSFNSADAESACIYPNLAAQKVLLLPLGEDTQNVLRNNAEVLLSKKDEVIVRPTDLATAFFRRRVGFPVQNFTNHSFARRVASRLNNLVCLHVGRNEIDLRDDLRGGLLIIAAEHFVFSRYLIWQRLCGIP